MNIGAAQLQMESGDIRFLPVQGIDEQGVQRNINANLECLIVAGNDWIVRVFPGCKIGAVTPGSVRMQARYVDFSQVEIVSDLVDVVVVPKQVPAIAYDFTLSEWQNELWVTFSGLISQNYYLAKMLLANRADQTWHRSSIMVIPGFNNYERACRNTLPYNARQVACHFQAESNNVTVIIGNDAINASADNKNSIEDIAFGGRIDLETARDYEQLTVSYSRNNPVALFSDLAVSGYIFTNEMATNNRHFYQFTHDTKPPGRVKVTLSGYKHLVALGVSWGAKVCTSKMTTITDSQTTCVIPEYSGGEINVEIEGNNGVMLLNAPAAVDGGTNYTLQLQLLD